jgi:hypothetical protein
MPATPKLNTLAEYVKCSPAISKRNRDRARIPYIVCTMSRTVIYGYASGGLADPMTLHDARMVFQWGDIVSGVFGLADVGPIGWESDVTRVSARAPEVELTGTLIAIQCLPRAEELFNEVLPRSRKD